MAAVAGSSRDCAVRRFAAELRLLQPNLQTHRGVFDALELAKIAVIHHHRRHRTQTARAAHRCKTVLAGRKTTTLARASRPWRACTPPSPRAALCPRHARLCCSVVPERERGARGGGQRPAADECALERPHGCLVASRYRKTCTGSASVTRATFGVRRCFLWDLDLSRR